MAIISGKKYWHLTFLRDSKWPRAASHTKHKYNSPQEKYFIVALWKLLCAVIWKDLMEVGAKEVRRFPWSLKCKGSLDSSCIPLDTAVWAKSCSWVVASLGQRKNLSSATSLWEQGWTEEAFGGLGWFTDLHIPGFPWEGKASAACGGKESSGFLCKLFDLISCCCLVSLMVSGAVTWTDAVLLCRQKMKKLFVSSVARSRCWQGPAPRAEQNPSDAHPRLEGRAEGEGLLSESGAFLKPCNPVDASLLYFF